MLLEQITAGQSSGWNVGGDDHNVDYLNLIRTSLDLGIHLIKTGPIVDKEQDL